MLTLSQERYIYSSINDQLNWIRGDAVALPFKDETFDVAVSIQVYEYLHGFSQEEAEAWQDDLRRIRECGRYFFSLNRYVFLVEKTP
jgi:hypothetical protein